MDTLSAIFHYWWVVALVVFLVGYKWTFWLIGVAVIPEDSIGIVNKKFVLFGKNKALPDGKIIALNGEAGFQADTLAPGIYFGYWPWQFTVLKQKFITVPEGAIGVVEARDGTPLTGGRVLAKRVECDAFQDARKFLSGGGERGPQITIIPPGTYRINTQLFTIVPAKVTEIPDNMVGIVTTKEGTPLGTGDIAGKEISGHNSFQDAQTFIDNGGFKGLQEQVILAGRYFINPRFATIEVKEMTTVPIASAGVVIAYVGAPGVDVSGPEFQHGNLVSRGQKGVWAESLDPGKYAINPYTHKVEIVPTANVVLNWATGKTEAHNLDKNLSTIKVRSGDGFTFTLDVSQIIHISRNEAPKVIARFGSVANMVTQVLEPIIGNHFRNSAQGSDVIDFLKRRSERQEEAKDRIGKALLQYNVVAVDTLIGDIVPPPELMTTLTDRKVAEQERLTFATQQMAQEARKLLEQASAQANTQASVVTAERSVEIARFTASAAVEAARGSAESKTINAQADATVLVTVGEAEGRKVKAVGEAEAAVIQLKTNAVGPNNYALIQVGSALAGAGIPLVPQIVAGGSSGGKGGTIVDMLLAGLLQKQVEAPKPVAAAATAEATPAAEKSAS
ncbi:MAG: hypothetical protein RLZZ26_433 [Candidatus Parcubacteria bacterium]|jgi:uncharacterized membrane protein YqiK